MLVSRMPWIAIHLATPSRPWLSFSPRPPHAPAWSSLKEPSDPPSRTLLESLSGSKAPFGRAVFLSHFAGSSLKNCPRDVQPTFVFSQVGGSVRAILSTPMFLGLRPARQRRRTACSPPCSQTQVSQGGQAAHQAIQVPRRMGEVRQNPTTAPKQIPIRGPRQGEGSTPPHNQRRHRRTGYRSHTYNPFRDPASPTAGEQ
jgi:hypothetical protein